MAGRMIWLYRLLYLPGLALVLPYYLFRMWRRGGYSKDFQHRFGLHRQLPEPTAGRQRVWIQAVSVGEVLAVRTIVDALHSIGSFEIVLTTTTSTGYREARKHYNNKVLSVGIFPLDFWIFSRAAWRRIRPDVILLTESELWPEHLHQARQGRTPAFLINARMSDKSFQRYRKVKWLVGRILQKFEGIYPASESDKVRLQELGAPERRLFVYGSIKLDTPTPKAINGADSESLLKSLGFDAHQGTKPIIILGSSTWPGEELALIRIVERLIASGLDCRLLLVPRHAERGSEIARILAQHPSAWHQRSAGPVLENPIVIHLADTTGELGRFTRIADIAFIGKSLQPNQGGQSPVDAAGLGVPILFGPEMNNFRDIARALVESGAAREVDNEVALGDEIARLARDSALRNEMSSNGRQWHQRNQGSSQRIAESIAEKLKN